MDNVDEKTNETLLKEYFDSGKTNKSVREQIILNNRHIVNTIAFETVLNKSELDDAVQTGYIGLMKAIDGYDLNSGTLFITYASRCIRSEIQNFVNDQNNVFHNNLFGQRKRIVVKNEECPNVKNNKTYNLIKGSNYFDNIAGYEGYVLGTDGNVIQDSRIKNNHKEDKVDVNIILNEWIIDEKERDIVRQYFIESKPLSAISKKYGVSKQWCDYIKNKVIERLKERVGNSDK